MESEGLSQSTKTLRKEIVDLKDQTEVSTVCSYYYPNIHSYFSIDPSPINAMPHILLGFAVDL